MPINSGFTNIGEKDCLLYKFTAKELDEEAGLYYYEARYLNPKYSRWISAEPALGEYIPKAQIDEEDKKHSRNLPGMGGVSTCKASIPTNSNLYAYGANNPIRYIDPTGREVKNKRNDYVLLKTEKSGFVILPPQSTYTGNNIVDGISSARLDGEKPFDVGKIDGAIYSSGLVVKVSDDFILPWNVDVTLIGKSFEIGSLTVEFLGYLSNSKSVLGNLICNIGKLAKLRTDFSGVKTLEETNWLTRPLSQSELEQLSIGETGTYFTKEFLETKIKEWDEK